ncbi:MAG: hypothetical protein CVU56_02060 [Deltaproteobacteria bacterium HGW-Deltaproteobacteria-14]|jgi:long-chain fatty acid transport protein|nr:MAG: hypothetical protein CVU56_02060 [Deltaproteobacteria bacterium HGW-Deltaproteobacteria-14]
MKQPRISLVGVAVTALTLLASNGARAGSFYLPERGARAMAMGGAHIAGSDDMNAQWLNPAALTRLHGDLALYVDLGLIMTQQTFARADDAEVMRKDPRYANGFPEVHNEGPPFPDPSLGIATRFGTEDFVFALGLYGPYAGTNEWPEEGPQRYSLVTLSALELFVQASVAWRISDELSIGVGLQWVVTQITQRLAISGYPGVFGWAEQPDIDNLTEVSVSDVFTPSANLGVLITPVPGFDIGLSGQLPVHVDATGELAVRLPSHYYFSDTAVQGDKIGLRLDFPAIIRLGLRVHDDDLWSVELAAVLELWSALDEIDVIPGAGGISFTNVPGIGSYTVKAFSLRADSKDVISVRLGGSFRPGRGLVTLRLGALYESTSLPDATTSVLTIDNNKIGGGLGATFHLGAYDIDLAAAYIQQLERTVTDSVKYQVNPIYDQDPSAYGDTGPHVVGNGTYTGSYLMFAATFNASF